jgi:hypothetical protein
MNARLFLGLLFTVTALTACSSGDEGTTGDDQNIVGAPAHCMAAPACAPDEERVSVCLMHESVDQCHGVSLCSQTIMCRKKPPAQCEAMPACGANEEQVDVCMMSDSVDVCHGVSLCGHTITCRKTH